MSYLSSKKKNQIFKIIRGNIKCFESWVTKKKKHNWILEHIYKRCI